MVRKAVLKLAKEHLNLGGTAPSPAPSQDTPLRADAEDSGPGVEKEKEPGPEELDRRKRKASTAGLVFASMMRRLAAVADTSPSPETTP